MLSPAHVMLYPMILLLFEEQYRRESPHHARLSVFALGTNSLRYSPFMYLSKDSSLPIGEFCFYDRLYPLSLAGPLLSLLLCHELPRQIYLAGALCGVWGEGGLR